MDYWRKKLRNGNTNPCNKCGKDTYVYIEISWELENDKIFI